MKHRVSRWALVAAGLTAVSCTDNRTPTEARPTLDAAAAPSAGTSCGFKTVRTLAGREFGPGDQNAVFALIKKMQDAGAGSAGATAAGFDIFARLSAVVNGGTQTGSAQTGSDLTNALIACMSVGPVTLPIDFTPALGPLGAYEVRGGAADGNLEVVSRDGFSGVQAPLGGFAGWLGGRTLFYGTPISAISTREQQQGNAYDWSTIPVRHTGLIGQGTVALCVANPNGALRVQEDAAIIPVADPSFLPCTGFLSAAPTLHDGLLFGMARRVLRAAVGLFQPAPLLAALKVGGTGGLAGGFSRFGAVNAGSVHLQFTQQPVDGFINQLFSVKVLAVGDGGTPLPGVSVTLTVLTNNGTTVLFSGTTPVSTDGTGVASFSNLSINKAGGYRLIATGTADGLGQSAPVQSNLFNLQQ